ncbi:hypothetical protein BJ912DRAFT_1009130, partial [Pholiota molesta]
SSTAPQVRALPLPSNHANPPPQRHFTVCPAVPAVHAGPASGRSCGARRPSPMPPSTAPQVHWPANRASTPPQRYAIICAAPPAPTPCTQAQPDVTSARTRGARRPSPTPPHCAVTPVLAAVTQPSRTRHTTHLPSPCSLARMQVDQLEYLN